MRVFHEVAAATDQQSLALLLQAGLGEKRVRRRLRLLTEEAHQRHRNRMALWVLAMVPQLPLMVSQ